jgi:Domain of unknown function (DUF3846)
MKDALIIPAAGDPYAIQLPEDGNAELAVLQQAVGGYIELVPNPHGVTVYCNEEGKLEGLPPNHRATKLFGEWLQPWDIIAGDVIVCGPPDEEGENTSLDRSWIKQLTGGAPVGS